MKQLEFSGNVPLCLALLAIGVTLTIIAYHIQFRQAKLPTLRIALVILRCLAIAMVALILARPVITSRWQDKTTGTIHIIVDASSSMQLSDEVATGATTRYARARELLWGTQGLARRLSSDTPVKVYTGAGNEIQLVWQANPLDKSPPPEYSQPAGARNDSQSITTSGIGRWLSSIANQAVSHGSSDSILLLTDGRSTSVASLEDVTSRLQVNGHSVYAVGYGATQQQPDIVLKELQVPSRVFALATVYGTVVIDDRLPAGSVFDVQLESNEQVVWEQSLTSTGLGYREVAFEVEAARILATQPPVPPNELASINRGVQLQCRIATQAPELTGQNNSMQRSLAIKTQASNVLLIDGRSRWETRYLKNLFVRDAAWDVQAAILGSEHKPDSNSLPTNPADWAGFDLIILGDVDGNYFSSEHLEWLLDAIENGTGLILIDGARGHLHSEAFSKLAPLLPVERNAILPDVPESRSQTARDTIPWHIELEPSAREQSFLFLMETAQHGDSTQHDDLWKQLPELRSFAKVRAKPNAETLASIVSLIDRHPLLVQQRYGRGNVVYLSTDETWRWRYKLGDKLHGKLWNQLALWTQRSAVSASNDFVTISVPHSQEIDADSNASVDVPIQCTLRTPDRLPATNRDVQAIVLNMETGIIQRFVVPEDASQPGSYAGRLSGLPIGSYDISLEADGFPSDILDVHTELFVTESSSRELEDTTCNETALQHVASSTHGSYFHETESTGLLDKLAVVRGSEVQEESREVWPTYGWFGITTLLLTLEWILRKRLGLV